MSRDARAEILRGFRAGELDVLVNVLSVLHGLDVPETRTVFLLRPTASDILMQEMIGRAARCAPGKHVIYVVDFVDNVSVHRIPVLRPDGFLGSRPLEPGSRGPSIVEHDFVKTELAPFPHAVGYEEIEGLPVQANVERDLLLRELSRAVGMDGRDRRAGATSERARASVTRAVRQALVRVREHHPSLGKHLDRTIRTGTFCAYEPDPRSPVVWEL